MHATNIKTTAYLLEEVIIDYRYKSMWSWLFPFRRSLLGAASDPQALVVLCLDLPTIVRILYGAPNHNQSPTQARFMR